MSSIPDPDLKLRFLWLTLGYLLVCLVIYLSVTSTPIEFPELPSYQDKIFHTLAYFTLMAWFAQIYHRRFQRNTIALLFIFMGMLMEYIQSYEPTRFADGWDMLANASGVVLGFLLTYSAMKNVLLTIEKVIFQRGQT